MLIVNRYRTLCLLGHSEFAEVYLAEDIKQERRVVIKFLKQLDDQGIQTFRSMVPDIARLNNRNIISIHDFGINEIDNAPFLVMEYTPEGNLRQRHKVGPHFTYKEINIYASQIAYALQYAHSQKIIHGEIKPENILIGTNGKILLTDFGIATIIRRWHDPEHQHVGEAITYMAPEQIQGMLVPESDQYALAAVIYEWLCGIPPFTGSPQEIIDQKINEVEPLSLRNRLPDISRDLEAIIQRALQKRPEERFANIQDFAHSLENALMQSSDPGIANPPAISPWNPFIDAPHYPSSYPSSPPSLYSNQPRDPGYRPPEPIQETQPSPPITAKLTEQLQFTAFHARIIPVECWQTLLVYAHTKDTLSQIQNDMELFKKELGALPRTTNAQSGHTLSRGTEITIIPSCKDATFNPDRVMFKWMEDWHRIQFRFQASERLAGSAGNGELVIYAGPLIIATLRLAFIFEQPSFSYPADKAEANEKRVQASPYRQIFASYSHADMPVVLACRNAYRALGYDFLRDVDTLRSGQNWNSTLLKMIDRADIFQLFWSVRSAKSKYVREEWQHALLHHREDGFIRPVYWEKPQTPPPDELAKIHFAYIQLPRLTISGHGNLFMWRLIHLFRKQE